LLLKSLNLPVTLLETTRKPTETYLYLQKSKTSLVMMAPTIEENVDATTLSLDNLDIEKATPMSPRRSTRFSIRPLH